jgi:hypothetical protein
MNRFLVGVVAARVEGVSSSHHDNCYVFIY